MDTNNFVNTIIRDFLTVTHSSEIKTVSYCFSKSYEENEHITRVKKVDVLLNVVRVQAEYLYIRCGISMYVTVVQSLDLQN